MKGIKNEPYGSFQLVENHKRKEFQSSAAACTSRSLLIFLQENFIFRKKNRFPADFAPGNPKDFSKIWQGWQWRGSLLPRPPRRQKYIFDGMK